MKKDDFLSMIKNPSNFFSDPKEILAVDNLNAMQKREILKSWVAKSVADIMQGGDKKRLREVLKALLTMEEPTNGD